MVIFFYVRIPNCSSCENSINLDCRINIRTTIIRSYEFGLVRNKVPIFGIVSIPVTGEIYYGKVPAYSVVVPGSLPNKTNPDGPSLYCAVIVKKVDEKTRSKTSINDLLRD